MERRKRVLETCRGGRHNRRVKSIFCRSLILAFVFTWGLCASNVRAAGHIEAPRVDVILWFDTEDYLLPADDDASLRLAKMLTERRIRATFKMVGEKARVL